MPGKNIRALCGHPLLAYSIEASLRSKRIDKTVCSTDSPEVAEAARRYGVSVGELRPERLAGDRTTDLEVFLFEIERLKAEGYEPDLLVHLRPTTPLRKPDWIDRAVEMLESDPEADSVRSVCETPIHPCKMWKNDPPYLSPLIELEDIREPYNMPRQALPEVFWQTATLDVVRSSTLKRRGSMTGSRILPFFIPPELAVDIDVLRDFDQAEAVMRREKDLVRPTKEKRIR